MLKRIESFLLLSSLLISCGLFQSTDELDDQSTTPTTTGSFDNCTSFCLENGDHCIFGANQDNRINAGLIFINPRHVMKTAWDPSTTGVYPRWISKYGSVSFVHGGYQMAWAGMNEAGLMISTMALGETQNPLPDERPPLVSSFWAQYQLDNFSTIEEVIASDSEIRIADTVDHYLVCDARGACATIEYLDGDMVVHTGVKLPVKVLTNSVYQEALSNWEAGEKNVGMLVQRVDPNSFAAGAGLKAGDWVTAIGDVRLIEKDPVRQFISELNSNYEVGDQLLLTVHRQAEGNPIEILLSVEGYTTEEGKTVPFIGRVAVSSGNSLDRFNTAAKWIEEYEPGTTGNAIAYTFEILEMVALDFNAWQIVFDPAKGDIFFRTNNNPEIRQISFESLNFSCNFPVMMMDVHKAGSGDMSSAFVPYDHGVSLKHTLDFLEEYERIDYPPILIEVLLRGLEAFPCMEEDVLEGEISLPYLERYDPLIPVQVSWAVRALIVNLWPVWLTVTLLSLVYVIWRMAQIKSISLGQKIMWGGIVLLFGPLGLIIFLFYQGRAITKRPFAG